MLNHLMGLFRLQAEVYHNARVCGDWLITESEMGQTCFHMATEGCCYLDLPGRAPVLLDTGDLVIFPRETCHSMRPETPGTGEQVHVPYHQPGMQGVGMLCGRLLFDHQGFEHLLDALPEVILIPRVQAKCWLEPLIDLIRQESYRSTTPTSVVLDRSSELLFMLALRHFIEQEPEKAGVLALYSEPRLAKALEAMHQQVQQPWTLQTLAEQAGMSRTAFANLFKSVSGWTPMQYLTWLRMQIAWSALAEGAPIAEAAESVGYQSESAFSRVFKKTFQLSAGQVRKRGPRQTAPKTLALEPLSEPS